MTTDQAWGLQPRKYAASPPSRLPLWAYALALGVAIAAVYLVWAPATPDYAAQTAWATLVHQAGAVPVFGRWFGGVSVGSYSLLVPVLTGALSVRIVGAAAAVVSLALVVPLVRGSRNQRLAVTVFAICTTANLLSGRVTFAVGVAIGVVALAVVARGWIVAAGLLAVCTYAASPVAGVLLLIPVGAMVINDRSQRSASLAAVSGVLAAAALSHWLFPLPGYEPFNRGLMLTCLVIQLGIAAAPVSRRLRIAALLGALLIVATYLVHTPLGGNVARLSVILMPAAAAAELATRRMTAYAIASVLLIYPIAQATGDVATSRDQSARPSFATGLERQLANYPIAQTQRIEVVDAINHWGSVRLAGAGFSIARGWLTQVDEVRNPEFYNNAPLTAKSYRVFLDQTASGYVAVERSAPLDSGSQAEAGLISRGLPYLTEVWSDPDWKLYRVSAPTPLATGVASVVRTTNTGLILDAKSPGRVELDINWSPYLTVTGGAITRDGSHVIATVTSPGEHTVRASWP